jgi:hypothetical protein
MEQYTHTEGPWVLTDVSLTIESPDLEPDSLTSMLGITPTDARSPGPSRWRPADDTNGLWILKCSDRISGTLDEQIDYVLSAFEPKRQELQKLITSGFQAYLQIHGFVGNGATFQLSTSTLERLARLGIPLKVSQNTNER